MVQKRSMFLRWIFDCVLFSQATFSLVRLIQFTEKYGTCNLIRVPTFLTCFLLPYQTTQSSGVLPSLHQAIDVGNLWIQKQLARGIQSMSRERKHLLIRQSNPDTCSRGKMCRYKTSACYLSFPYVFSRQLFETYHFNTYWVGQSGSIQNFAIRISI